MAKLNEGPTTIANFNVSASETVNVKKVVEVFILALVKNLCLLEPNIA